MSQTNPTPNQKVVTELKVSAHLMLLDPGLFCVFHAPGGPLPDSVSGLPGVRITRPPGSSPDAVSISTFNPDGWLGAETGAALVRVTQAPSQVLVTIYQTSDSSQEAPKLQVLRLSDAAPARPGQAPIQNAGQAAHPQASPAVPALPGTPTTAPAAPPAKLEVAAHVQRRGDLLTLLGEWMGERGSQNWIEGFAISPNRFVEPADIEYQAVLGKGWLSPWSEGGQYCGSRGMALPILGLRVRLKGDAAEHYDVRVSASFTDGTSVGPVDATGTAEAPSLAPLEAFMVEIVPVAVAGEPARATQPNVGAVPKAISEPVGARDAVRAAAAVLRRPGAAKPEPVRAEPPRLNAPKPIVSRPVIKAPPPLPPGRSSGKPGTKVRR
ncbi:hypothetical protein HN018_16085 [Lichenicola cladoniae]|uniref:Hydrophobic W protein n=1 Tax=Lichenicola cladoniae TaxID=1484109 RepID=A0A6M8HT47_9PROT|nr:hypothetical protein [Lichenicola cladoniae]NPD65601.1 hypothetical protein [Acetobacteraceae bacterium]QKE91361.1 hypothetical protein HN018_16085 [Lichenicola cladoniae]